jgi:ABC-type uncharacterized transport system substrate-binding protein
MKTVSERPRTVTKPGWRRRRGYALLATAVILLMLVGYYALRAERPPAVTPTRDDGQRWRIGYYEGGPYIDYAGGLLGLVQGLGELGWIEPITLPAFPDEDDTQAIWTYLAEHVESDYLEFVADAYWSANWDDAQREENRQEVLDRLTVVGDLDLMIAMGTWAGQDLATDAHSVPTMVLTSSDPVQAGIIESAEDSGLDHVVAEYDPYRYLRQIRLFHDIVDFQKLGVAHEDSRAGRVYANWDDLQQVARERGFKLVVCHAQDTNLSEMAARQELADCYRMLAPHIDALWIAVHQGEHPKFMPEILAPLFEHDVATWSQAGSDAVRRGVLISVAQQTDYTEVGRWYARTMARTLNGARPRDLDQVFELPLTIAVNLETARRIGFDPPPSLVEAADEVYTQIEGAP